MPIGGRTASGCIVGRELGSRAPAAGAPRQYGGRVAPQWFGIGVVQIATSKPDVREHVVVEIREA
jgi:hypothetical protein